MLLEQVIIPYLKMDTPLPPSQFILREENPTSFSCQHNTAAFK